MYPSTSTCSELWVHVCLVMQTPGPEHRVPSPPEAQYVMIVQCVCVRACVRVCVRACTASCSLLGLCSAVCLTWRSRVWKEPA